MYNNALSKYPVTFGDIWESTEGHRLYCGSCLDISLNNTYDLIYTDPPWNTRILNSFYSYAGVQTTYKFDRWISVFSKKITDYLSDGTLFIEMGVSGNQTIINTFSNRLQLCSIIESKYGKSTTMNITAWNRTGIINIPDVSSLKGMETANALISHFAVPNGLFLDPCAGEGYFLEMAIKAGSIVTGIELIKEKFASMLVKLSKYTKFERINYG